jgi:hypothetical protein
MFMGIFSINIVIGSKFSSKMNKLNKLECFVSINNFQPNAMFVCIFCANVGIG